MEEGTAWVETEDAYPLLNGLVQRTVFVGVAEIARVDPDPLTLIG
jgi:hypothetical protein